MNSSSSSPTPNDRVGSPTRSGSSEASNSKFKRNYRACLNCRVRKVKCDLGSVDQPRDGKCARCLRERKDCVFVESKRGGHANINNSKRRKFANSDVSNLKNQSDFKISAEHDGSVSAPLRGPEFNSHNSLVNILNNSGESDEMLNGINSPKENSEKREGPHQQPHRNNHDNNFTTMEGALVFLAKAAGSIARADERDNIDARKKHQQIEGSLRSMNSSDSLEFETNRGRNFSGSHTQVTSASETPRSNSASDGLEKESTTGGNSTIPSNNSRRVMPAAENGYVMRPKASNSLRSIEYIGESGILSEKEAEYLIHLFFTTMYPFFPYLPKWMHYPNVLPRYPILLCAILTICSRYHPLENNEGVNGSARNIEVHDKLWLYGQRLISQTVWAEASTRSIGTVFAFLLFTEWNPRAIHWRWSDYANKADDGNESDQADENGIDKSSDESSLAGLGAMRRSYRMAWMLIGSAIRLAQDMGFIDVSPNTFLAIHVSEINSAMNISGRSMLAHSLSEVELDDSEEMEDGFDKENEFIHMSEEEMKRVGKEMPLRFDFTQRAQLELLQIISLGHESLYSVKGKPDVLSQRQVLSLLGILSPLINNWGRKYKKLLVQTSPKIIRNVHNMSSNLSKKNSKFAKDLLDSIERESFIFEYNYLKVYLYSLALSPPKQVDESGKHKPRFSLKLEDISKSAKYIEQAFSSANEMLAVASRVHKLKRLKYMPVRWLTRIVRAIAFIVKCYLTITAHNNSQSDSSPFLSVLDNFDSTVLSLSLISIDEIMQSIHKAAITLRDSAPDELHLCTRYSNVLMYLYSEMKTKAKNVSNKEEIINEMHSDPKYGEELEMSNNEKEFSSESTKSYYSKGNIEVGDNYSDSSAYRGRTQSQGKNEVDSFKTPQFQNLMEESEVMEWFVKNNDIGLDFVGPWTEMIEQQLTSNDQYHVNEDFFDSNL